MMNKIALAVCIGLSSGVVMAETQAQTKPEEMTMGKEVWLEQLKVALPSLICKSFLDEPVLKQRFDELKMTYEQCVSLIPASAEKCVNDLKPTIPDTIDVNNASTWGRTIGECIGKDFAEKHLVPKS